MNLTEEKKIADYVAEDYRTAAVFKKYKIDFCCNGNRGIEEATKKSGIDPGKIYKELEEVKLQGNSGTTDYQSWPIDLLADYIEKRHHRYVVEKTPIIAGFLDKLCKVHGPNHPELFEIAREFTECAGQFAAHMKKEELILFPFIHKMVKAKMSGIELATPNFGTVENPVHMMMEDHDAEGERFRRIAGLSNNYTPPADGCNTYRVTYAMLAEFEEDLHLHVHLENNILFPKAIELEKELRN